jgi:hypothetical protein
MCVIAEIFAKSNGSLLVYPTYALLQLEQVSLYIPDIWYLTHLAHLVVCGGFFGPCVHGGGGGVCVELWCYICYCVEFIL